MRYLALATDYDGTLATHGRVEPAAVTALERLRASGRRLLLVTGRILADLAEVFPEYELFDAVVAENGGTLWRRGAGERALAAGAPADLVARLREAGVPVSAGRVVVATVEPHGAAMLAAVRDLGLELGLIFNKGAVMALPSGVNKATGLAAAVSELGLTAHEVVAVGDAENDHAMLAAAELGAAVANALPAVQERADVVTSGRHGAGVTELVEGLLADDLAGIDPARHAVLLGEGARGAVRASPYALRLLVTGASGSGKTSYASGVLERLVAAGRQVCVVDPEGDFEGFPGLTPIGTAERAPSEEEVLALLADPRVSPAVSLLGLTLRDRPRFFAALWPRLQALRAQTGRPHALLLDEAHHLLARGRDALPALPREPGGLVMISVHPERIAPEALGLVNLAVGVGEGAAAKLADFHRAAGRAPPAPEGAPDGERVGLLWREGEPPIPFAPAPARAAHRRHRRKYATGDVQEKAFTFRGPGGKLRLRAQNLQLFLQLADGVDDDTWRFHQAQGDYSRWFREAIKDDELAAEAAEVERSGGDPADARRRLREAVERRYVLDDPAGGP